MGVEKEKEAVSVVKEAVKVMVVVSEEFGK